MVTIVNTPAPQDSSGDGIGFLLGTVLIAAVIIIFLYYGIPYLNRRTQVPSVHIPDRIDVNVNQPVQPSQ